MAKIGKKFGNVKKAISVFDAIVDMIGSHISKKYKIEKKLSELKKEVIDLLYKTKKTILRSFVEATLLVTGILALVAGLIILINRFVPIEYVLIGYGLVITLFVLLQLKTGI